MTNEFKGFVDFIRRTTGRHPEFAESFEDLYIYVPSGKTPPDAEEREPNSPRTVSIGKYMANRNKDFVECVYHVDWNRLEHHLGPQLLRFCLLECILAKKTATGAFMVSNLMNLRNKIPPLESPPKITVPYCRKAKEYLSGAREDKVVPNLKHLLRPTELEITTDYMLRRNSKSQRFPPSHTLMRRNDGPHMSSQVINLRVGAWQVVGHQDCIQPLQLILDKLRKNHQRYAYEAALDRLINSECIKSKGTYTSGNPIPVPVLKTYFGQIMQRVVPKELLGSHRNRNAVIKSICELLDAPEGQAIGLEPYISRMKISDIPWLEGVKDTDSQWCLIAQLVKWLFREFILELFSTQLYITVADSRKKIYFKHRDWQKRVTQFWREMKSEGVIAKSDFVTSRCCEGRWMLFPQETGVRPIMSAIGARREITRTALCYLQQLHATKHGASGSKIFLEEWRNFVENFRSGNETMYLVRCDIQDAYRSIDQNKLFGIVESLAASTGPELCRKWYRVGKDLTAVKSESTKLEHYFAFPELELPVAPNSIFACASDKVDKISKKTVLGEIRRNILNQNLLNSGQRFVLQKGIAQGAMLSPVLCDIYYSDMEDKNLSEFRDRGFLYRYVDGFLFATGDKDLAERFLQHVNAGFPEYHCGFNAANTRSNLLPTKDCITFLGFSIDPHTFEVTPNYPKSPRYTTLLSKPRNDILKTFFKRLANLATLKLEGLILDCKINSRETIVHSMKCVFMRQAERCLWLLQALFEDIPGQLKSIFRIIKSTNLRVIQHMQRYFLDNGYSFEDLIPTLWETSWSSYRQVFGKKQHIHAHFRNLFLHYMKLNQ